MKTFDFTIEVDFFHGHKSKVAVLKNFTYSEALSVFNDLRLKYANDDCPFKDITMICSCLQPFRIVNYICSDFIDSLDE